ncbi:autotransporter outer membrane beta-barrel domain-containing protein [Gallibacterium salpingitidis]|uniref:Autotransporter domain-containing protein n=1 Tax=Gallibacterium salpingitidis TaxID=505341 RepID=A0A1A7P0T4_9PAST|nr:autotransporter outer membrane beta-barrel domain-containing protein [Gallibacterium salpingitidis]OBW94844.1 hypothetical protein QS62_05200 [Gallibacterium salpingitidis]
MDSNVLRIHGQGTHLNILQDDYLKPALSLGIYPRSAKDKIPTIEVSDGAVLETHSYIDVGSIEAVGEVHRESYGKLVVNNAYVLIDWLYDGEFMGKGMLAIGNYGEGEGLVEVSGNSFVYANKGVKFYGAPAGTIPSVLNGGGLVLNGGVLMSDMYRSITAGNFGGVDKYGDFSMGDQGYTAINQTAPDASRIYPAHMVFNGGALAFKNATPDIQPALLFNGFYTLAVPEHYSITVGNNDAKLVLAPTSVDSKAVVQFPHAAITPEQADSSGGLTLEKQETNYYTGEQIQGGGTLVLTADNRYKGDTRVEVGTLEIGGEGYMSLALYLDNKLLNRSYRVEDLASLQDEIAKLPQEEQTPYYFGENGDIGEGDVYLGLDQANRATLKISRSRNIVNGDIQENVPDDIHYKEYVLDNGIHGYGDLYQSGSALLKLMNSANDFIGDVFIEKSAIYIEDINALGRGENVMMGKKENAQLILNLQQDTTLNHHIKDDDSAQGKGSLLKQDNHILTFSKDYQYTYSGDTDVQAGEIVLAKGANIPNSAIKMASATVLRAETGAHAIGALSLADKTNQVNIVANSFNDYSQLHAQGAVTLNGQLMVDASAWNTPVAGNGKLPNVITSQQQLSGQFSSYQDNSALFDFVPEYDYANKAMHLVINHAANCANTSAGMLGCYIPTNYPNITPTDVEASVPLLTGSGNSILNNDVSRLALYTPRIPCTSGFNQGKHNVWVETSGNWDHQREKDISTGYRGHHNDVAIGTDTCVEQQQLRLGVMAGYAYSDVHSVGTPAIHNFDSDLFQLGIYGDKVLREKVDMDFQTGYAKAYIDGKRYLPFANLTAKANYQGDVFYAGLGFNYRADNGLSPFIRADYALISSKGYHETGAGAYNFIVKPQYRQSLIFQTGVNIDKAVTEKFIVNGQVGLGIEALDEKNYITAAFEATPDRYFTMPSAERGRLFANAKLGFDYHIENNVTFSVDYRVKGNQSYYENSLMANLKVTF